jgi:hypothetical protein
MRRQSKIWARGLYQTGDDNGEFDKPLGKFRKRRAHGCKPRCRLCHAEKLDGRKGHQEMQKIISEQQQIEDLTPADYRPKRRAIPLTQKQIEKLREIFGLTT